MARLPDVIATPPPVAERPSTAVVAPTDFGLGDLSKGIKAVSDAKQQIDNNTAAGILRNAQAAYEPRFGERTAAYDGRESGFASRELMAFSDHFEPVLDDPTLKPGVRDALQNQVAAYKAQLGDRAIAVETQKRAGVIADQEKAKTDGKISDGLVGFNAAFSKTYQARVDAFDGSDPNFAHGVQQDFDAAAQGALAEAPADVKDALSIHLAEKRVQVLAQAMETQDKSHVAFIADKAKTTVGALINNVTANPAAYDHTVGDLDQAAAQLPAALRNKFLEESRSDMAAARIEGLVFKGDTAQAHAELSDGRFAKILKPEKTAALLARVDAAERGGPKTLEQWRQAYEADANITAEVDARSRGSTTGFSLGQIVGVFSPREIAEAEQRLKQADQVFAATGNLKAQTNDQLHSRAIAPAPDTADPLYGEKFKAWELSRKAAAGELEARQKDPAAWAMNSERPGDTGAQLQQRYQDFVTAADPATMGAAGRKYAFLTLGLQAQAGTPTAALRVFTKDQAGELAQSYARSPPEQRAASLRQLALTVAALPVNVPMGDGRTLSAAGLALKELRAGGLGLPDIAAITDLRDDPGKLGLYADAVANPAARVALTAKGAEALLKSQVDARLAPYFHSANALPGSAELNFGRQAQAMIVARHLITANGMSPADAARQATAPLADGYRFTDGWRMPAQLADADAGLGTHAIDVVRKGAMYALAELVTTGGGQLSAAPATDAVAFADRQKLSAQQVEKMGRWMTTEREDGLQLMVGDPRGWTPMADKYGRPIRLTWSQLQAMDDPSALHRKAYSWMDPPPNAAAPPAADPGKARAAFTAAIEGRETGGLSNPASAVSPRGALGPRQMMPDTAKAAAARLGVPFDPARLLTDPAYNRKLSDNEIEHLAGRYDGNVALMAAGYNAGPGAVDGWLRQFGDPRTGKISVDDFVARIPYPETRAYVRNVLPRALANLRRGG